MTTKIRVEKLSSDDIDEWSDFYSDDEESSKGRKRIGFNGKKRRLIEDTLEERRLMSQISDDLEQLDY